MKLTKQELDELYREYEYYIRYIVYKFLESHKTFYYMHDDLVGEASLKFLNIVDKFDEESTKFSTFLQQQLYWYLTNAVAKEARITTGEAALYHEIVNSPTEEYEEMNDVWAFDDMLIDGRCTTQQKRVLEYKFKDELTEEEIADKLRVSQQAVNRIFQRAIARLKKNLEDTR